MKALFLALWLTLPPFPPLPAATISNINLAVTCSTSVLINFNTSVPTHAYIEYGTTEGYGSATIDDPVRFFREQAIPLTSLSSGTLYHFRVIATDGDGNTTITGDQTFSTSATGTACPALPIQVDSRMPDMTGASEVTVKASGGTYTPSQFQTALDSCVSGGVGVKQYITVDAGVTLTGGFTLPAKTGTNWCIIRTSQHASLPEGRRLFADVAPGYNVTGSADLSKLFKITNTNVTAPIATVTGGTGYWRFIGAEVTMETSALGKAPSGAVQSGLLRIGTGSETSASQLPHHIGIDRCFVHGLDERNFVRGAYINGDDHFVIESYFSKFHSAGNDSQAVLSLHSRRLKILNNYLEGAGENFMSGGATLSISGFVPSDISFERNDCPGLLSWKANSPTAEGTTFTADVGTDSLTAVGHGFQTANFPVRLRSTGTLPSPLTADTTYFVRNPTTNALQLSATSGGPAIDIASTGSGTHYLLIDWVNKNRFELKTSNRVLVFGNTFHGWWPSEQTGAIINLKLEDNSSVTNDLFQDVVFYKNKVYDTAMGITIAAATIAGAQTDPYGKRITISYNLVEIDGVTWDNEDTGADGVASAYAVGPASFPDVQYPDYLTIAHNTTVNANPTPIGTTGGNLALLGAPSTSHKGVGFIFENNIVGHRQYGVKADGTGIGTAALNVAFTGYDWEKNLMVGGVPSGYPECSLCQSAWAGVQFVNFNGGVSGDYRLSASSPGKNAATDGTDVGADIDALIRATEFCLTGDWQSEGTAQVNISGKIRLTGVFAQ